MAHIKEKFKFHKKFDTKYIDQTYYAFLYRDNVDFISRGIPESVRNVNFIPRHAILVNEFIICCNNNLARRGSLNAAKERIAKDFEYMKTIKLLKTSFSRYANYGDDIPYVHLIEIADMIDNDNSVNNIKKKESKLIKLIYYWSEKFQEDFEGFMDFIYDEIIYFDKQHYDWVKDGEIIYDRSIRDNEKKRVYCVVNGDKANDIFKKIYFNKVSIEPKYKSKLYKQITYMLVNVADINNLFVSKKFDEAKELLNEYVKDNMNIDTCHDIYYRKVFENIRDIAKEYSISNNSTIAFKEIQKLIAKENEKYKEELVLYKEVAIDLTKNEYAFIKEI